MKKILLLFALFSLESLGAVGVFSNDFSQQQASDFAGGLLYPYFKLSFGPDGTALPISSSNPLPVASAAAGQSTVTFVRLVYSSTNVTTSAWVQLIASTSAQINKISIFDSSGQTLEIGFGAMGSEVAKFIVFPGGNGDITLSIPASTRISIQALSATANNGEFDLNALQ